MSEKDKEHSALTLWLWGLIDGNHLANLSGIERGVLMILHRHADYDTCIAWPSSTTIARKLGIAESGRSRVLSAIKNLSELGFLQTVKDGGGTDGTAHRKLILPSVIGRVEKQPGGRVEKQPGGRVEKQPEGVGLKSNPRTFHKQLSIEQSIEQFSGVGGFEKVISEQVNKKSDKRPAKKKDEDMPGFDRFWAAWPNHRRKKGKPKCKKKWKSERLEQRTDAILSVLAAFKTCDDWQRDNCQYIPGPLVWLNDEAYDVDPATLRAGRSFDIDEAIRQGLEKGAKKDADRLRAISIANSAKAEQAAADQEAKRILNQVRDMPEAIRSASIDRVILKQPDGIPRNRARTSLAQWENANPALLGQVIEAAAAMQEASA